MTISPEMIAAYADGELGAQDRARVEAAMASDPELADAVERHRALRSLLAARYDPIAAEPVPARLTALLAAGAQTQPTSGEVVDLAQVRERRSVASNWRRWLPVAGPALAASLVLALWQPWQQGEPEGYAPRQLAAVLETQRVASQPADAGPRVLLSFEAKDGRYCRAWRGATDGGIACRDATGWKLEQRFAVGRGTSGEFRQAGSGGDIMAAAQDMAAGDALDAAAEARAIQQGWVR